MTIQDQTWHILTKYCLSRLKNVACQQFWDGWNSLDLSLDKMPDLNRFAEIYFQKTGWTLVRAEGEVPSVEFLLMLSRKEFPLVWELRGINEIFASSEPDLWHEIVGHACVLTNPQIQDLYWTIGNAVKEAIDNPSRVGALIRIYWFFGEYGILLENGRQKILGAGFLASPLGSDRLKYKSARIRPWTLERVLEIQYESNTFQKNLFSFSSLDTVYTDVVSIH